MHELDSLTFNYIIYLHFSRNNVTKSRWINSIYTFNTFTIYFYVFILFLVNSLLSPSLRRSLTWGWIVKTASQADDDEDPSQTPLCKDSEGETAGVNQHLKSLTLERSKHVSVQIIIFNQPRFPWNKGISLTKPPFGVRSCEVAIIWPDVACLFRILARSQSSLSHYKSWGSNCATD